MPTDWVNSEDSVPAPRFLLPPLAFVAIPATATHGAGFRLMMDFFQNDWVLYSREAMAKDLSRAVPLPSYAQEEGEAAGTFLQAMGGKFREPAGEVHAPESDGDDD
jgi:hypothetical protein